MFFLRRSAPSTSIPQSSSFMDNSIVLLLQKLDSCSVDDCANLNNELAQKVMGWHLADNDPYRLWRQPDGEMVRIDLGNFRNGHPFAGGVLVCAHPWVDGVNLDNHLSFNPVLNYNKSVIDWRQILDQRYSLVLLH